MLSEMSLSYIYLYEYDDKYKKCIYSKGIPMYGSINNRAKVKMPG